MLPIRKVSICIPVTLYALIAAVGLGGALSLAQSTPQINILKAAEQFDDTSWTAFSKGVTVTDNAEEAPDGTKTAAHLVINGYIGQIIKEALPDHMYVFSVWAKSATDNPQKLTLAIENNAPSPVTKFVSFPVTHWDWTRCYISAPCPPEGNHTFRVSLRGADVFVWHPQLEETESLNPEPTDYVTGAAAVRPKVTLPPDISLEEATKLSQNISCWGDSLTQGAGGTPYPTDLQQMCPDRKVNNFGIGGQKSNQIKDRFMANPDAWADITIIWAGRNNYSDPSRLESDIATMVSKLKTRRFVVLSVINGNTEPKDGSLHRAITRINEDLAKMFPDNYLDIRKTLVDVSTANTTEDATDKQNDVPLGSLRSDKLHLNTAGYKLVAETVANFLRSKNWVSP